VVVVEATVHKVVPVVAELGVGVVAQEIIPILTVITVNFQLVTPVMVNQELVVVVAVAAITEAFHTATVAKVVLEL
jgi:hypothetical protein